MNMTIFHNREQRQLENSNRHTINNHCLFDVLNLRDFKVGTSKNEKKKRLYATHKGDHASKCYCCKVLLCSIF